MSVTDTAERSPTRRIARQRNIVLAILLALTALAWLLTVQMAAAESHAMDVRGLGLTMGMTAPLFLAMWTVMMAAMMFPASAPMVLTFSTMQARRRQSGRPYVPVTIFMASYLAVWAAFGLLAFGFAAGVDTLAERSGWLMANWHRLAGGLLIAAGVYQLTPLKDLCLGKCRNPFMFVLHHWREGPVGAFLMGLQHGRYCLGCCWLLFVILIPLGVMNLAAMLAVTVVVFAEKTLPGSRALARLASVALVIYGATVVALPSALPSMKM